MQFPLSQKKTPGKHYRNLKKIRKPDPLASIPTALSPDLLKYIEILQSKGLEIHKNLALATFRTQNSLAYTGILAKNYLNPNEILLKIPRDLLLTTKMAYFSEIKEIYDENPEFYSRFLEKNWEDNILLTYLLFEFQKKETSHLYFLIKLLPRDIDYMAFWSENELDLLEDPYLKKKSIVIYKEFEEIFEKLSGILSKYPQKFEKETFSYENVKWIHIHLITRSFGGKYLNYVTMVPFAEFFNHECTNVYYDFEQKTAENFQVKNVQNPKEENFEQKNAENSKENFEHKQNEENFENDKNHQENFEQKNAEVRKNDEKHKENGCNDQKNEENCKEEESLSTSNESDNSEESIGPDDFLEILPFSNESSYENEQILDKKLLENESLASNFREIIEWVLNSIDLGDVVSCFYFNEILRKLAFIKKNCYKSPKNKGKNDINAAFSQITVLNLKYKYHLLQYMSQTKGLDLENLPILSQKKVFLEQTQEKKDLESLKLKRFSDEELWKDDNFEYMVLKNSEKDFFLKNSQVYFCYGRLSNRKLLMRYGLALEYNKYDHIFIRIGVLEHLKATKDLINYISNLKLQKNRIFKLEAVKFNLDLLLFSKGIHWDIEKNTPEELFEPKNWDFEIKALVFMKEIFEKCLKEMFKIGFKESSELVFEKKMGYHEHFATIYRVERQRLLVLHGRILDVAIGIVKRIKKGESLEEAEKRIAELETEEEWERNRWMIKNYLEKVWNSNKNLKKNGFK